MGKLSKTPRWVLLAIGPITSLIAFVVTYYLDPLRFGEQDPFAAIPAFLLSILILLFSHHFTTSFEVQKTSEYSDRIYEAIKDYMHVTAIGSPEKAQAYINSRIPSLREVQNTSFNLDDECERSEEKYYNSFEYIELKHLVGSSVSKGLIWKDIGDSHGIERLRQFAESCSLDKQSSSKQGSYRYKIIPHNEAQINFIILEYKDGSREVLFNWDFRGIGEDPTVLLSRERQIVGMFAIQFANLWRSGATDYDNSTTKSAS